MTIQDVLGSAKTFFSNSGNAAGVGFGGGALVGGVAAGAVAHLITKRVIQGQMQCIASNADFNAIDTEFRAALHRVARANHLARPIVEQVLQEVSLFKEGAARAKGDTFVNPTIDADFIRKYNELPLRVQGRLNNEMLEAICVLKHSILTHILEYFERKDFLTVQSHSKAANFSQRVTVNEECKVDLGIVTMICFSNILLGIYDLFIRDMTDSSSLTLIQRTPAEMKETPGLFLDLIIGFTRKLQPLMQKGDSEFCDFFRSLFSIPSRRNVSLTRLIEAVKAYQPEVTEALMAQRKREELFSLTEGLSILGNNRVTAVKDMVYALFFAESAFLDEEGIMPDALASPSAALLEQMTGSLKGFYEVSLSLPEEVAKTLKFPKEFSSSKDDAHRVGKQLYDLYLALSLSNFLVSAIQHMMQKRGESAVTLPEFDLLYRLLQATEQTAITVFDDFLSLSHVSHWSGQLKQLLEGQGDLQKLDRIPTVKLPNRVGLFEEIKIEDPKLLALYRQILEFPLSFAQTALLRVVGGFQYQKELSKKIEKRRNGMSVSSDPDSEDIVRSRPHDTLWVQYQSAPERVKTLLKWCVSLQVLGNDGLSAFADAFSKSCDTPEILEQELFSLLRDRRQARISELSCLARQAEGEINTALQGFFSSEHVLDLRFKQAAEQVKSRVVGLSQEGELSEHFSRHWHLECSEAGFNISLKQHAIRVTKDYVKAKEVFDAWLSRVVMFKTDQQVQLFRSLEIAITQPTSADVFSAPLKDRKNSVISISPQLTGRALPIVRNELGFVGLFNRSQAGDTWIHLRSHFQTLAKANAGFKQCGALVSVLDVLFKHRKRKASYPTTWVAWRFVQLLLETDNRSYLQSLLLGMQAFEFALSKEEGTHTRNAAQFVSNPQYSYYMAIMANIKAGDATVGDRRRLCGALMNFVQGLWYFSSDKQARPQDVSSMKKCFFASSAASRPVGWVLQHEQEVFASSGGAP